MREPRRRRARQVRQRATTVPSSRAPAAAATTVAYGRRTHLVDPATGRVADTGLAAVVVTDHSTERAEVLSKAAFVAGRERGADLLARFGVDGWFLPLDTAA